MKLLCDAQQNMPDSQKAQKEFGFFAQVFNPEAVVKYIDRENEG